MSGSSSAEFRPNVLIYANDVGPWGGQDRSIEEFVLSAVEMGYPVTVVAFRASESVQAVADFVKVAKPRGPNLLRFAWYWFASARVTPPGDDFVFISCGAITAHPVDAIWLHFWHEDHLRRTGWVAAPRRDVVRFVAQSVSRAMALVGELWAIRVKKTRTLVGVSSDLVDDLEHRIAGSRVLELPNPVSTASSPALADERQAQPTVIFVGGEWARKGLLLTAEGASLAASGHAARIRFLIVGKGPATTLQRIAKLPNLDVEHVPWTDDVPRYLRSADALVLASQYETFAMAGHEALGLGLPVITTDVHGLALAVRQTGLGKVVPRTSDDFATAISEIVFEQRPPASVRTRAATWVESQYGATRVRDLRRELLVQLTTQSAEGDA